MTTKNQVWLSIVFTACWLGSGNAQPSKPVVVIPGILGSRLCDAVGGNAGSVVWGDRWSYNRFTELKLPITKTQTENRHKPCGLVRTINILGPWRIHQYDRLFETLFSLGYVENKNLFVFDYDWRLSNYDNADLLQKALQTWIGDQEFDIVAHSMGGIIARILIQNLPAGANVRRFVTLGTPHRGSADVFLAADEGWGFWKNLIAGGLNGVRETLLSFPSVYELLPSYKGCCLRGLRERPELWQPFSAFDAKQWQEFHWIPSEYQSPEGRAFMARVLSQAAKLHQLLASEMPQHISFVPIVTGLVDTKWKAVVEPADGRIVHWESYYGDGTVMEWSASDWNLRAAKASDAEHQRIFDSDAARTNLRWALVSDIAPTSSESRDDYRVTVHSPDGRRIKLNRVQMRVHPEVVRVGGSATFSLTLLGEPLLADVTIPLTIRLEHGGNVELLTARVVTDNRNTVPVQKIIDVPFTVPSVSGAHRIIVSIPGLQSDLEEFFLVMPN